ncbi:MAG: ATP-binding protein, partial [Ilumatobacteraceae bacterium]
GPTGLIFAMRSRYTSQTGSEAMFDEADTDFSSRNAAGDSTSGSGVTEQRGSNPAVLNDSPSAGEFTRGQGMTTAYAEALGDASGNQFAEMAFSIEKSTVTAKSRALKAEYTMELAQDLKAIHGLDAETELANILSAEILAEINREVVRTIYINAEKGAAVNTTTAGIFDLDTDSNGRWSVERFKGLMFQLERDANRIAQRTRRGKGNMIICSSDVASALQMAGVLDYTPALNNNLNVDDTGNTFAGVLNGRYKVYIDPYSANSAAKQYYVVGYKGTSPYDAGIFYCPYVPLQMVRAVGQDTFQPKIGFKTRYGLVANPFAETGALASGAATPINNSGNANSNRYYQRVQVTNIM